jgi:hypothetical protein
MVVLHTGDSDDDVIDENEIAAGFYLLKGTPILS